MKDHRLNGPSCSPSEPIQSRARSRLAPTPVDLTGRLGSVVTAQEEGSGAGVEDHESVREVEYC
jgi:hypothetical protein